MENRGRRGGFTAILDGDGCGEERVQMAISSYLDGEADATERAMAEWHLAECRGCNEMVALWGRDSGRIQQVAHDPEVEKMARAIADQTRSWLMAELNATASSQPRRIPTRSHSSLRLVFGGLAAALVLAFSLLTMSLSSFFTGPGPVAPTTAATNNLTMTLAVGSPGTVSRTQPLVSAPNFPMLLTEASPTQAEPNRLNVTKGIGQYAGPRLYTTPGIAPTKAAPLTRD